MSETPIYLEVDCEVITIQKGKVLVPVSIDLSSAKEVDFDNLVQSSAEIKELANNNTNLHSINFILKPTKFYPVDEETGGPDLTIEVFTSVLGC